MGEPPPRATLRVTTACSGACVFCVQDGLAAWPAEPSSLQELRWGSAAITLVGGDPGEVDDLPARIEEARAAGFETVGVQTNGRALAAPGRLETCMDAGLTDLHLSIHGASAPVHDYHTGVAGSFDSVEAVLARARSLALPVQVVTVPTRSNFRVLEAMPGFLLGHGVAAWLIEVPMAAGRLADNFDRVYPRLALALPHALQALSTARKGSLPAWIRGAPACLLGPLATLALPGPRRSHGPVCQECDARQTCPGLDPAYLERFGGDELRRRDAAAPAVETPLTRGFVGPGPLAARTPGRPTRSLPVLG